MRKGTCARRLCGHDRDSHHEGLHRCSVFRCDCSAFIAEGQTVPERIRNRSGDDAFCDCGHLHVDHSAVGCHWCSCVESRR